MVKESSDERYIYKVPRFHTDNHKIYKNKKKKRIIQALNKPSIFMVYFAKLK